MEVERDKGGNQGGEPTTRILDIRCILSRKKSEQRSVERSNAGFMLSPVHAVNAYLNVLRPERNILSNDMFDLI